MDRIRIARSENWHPRRWVPNWFMRLWCKHQVWLTFDKTSYAEIYEWCMTNVNQYNVHVEFTSVYYIDPKGRITQRIAEDKIKYRFHCATDAVAFKLTFSDFIAK